MKHTKISKILLVLFAVVLCFGPVGLADPLGTAFTYQGRLIDANKAADGLYDFQFKLFDANSGGNKLGADVNKPQVDVIDGYFTVELDFGSVFDGNNRWLEIGVRPGVQSDPCAYSLLSPRQKITPTPYALHIRGILVDNFNTFVGLGAGQNNTGSGNTFSGVAAGYFNTTGFNNTFSGFAAGYSNTSGSDNTFSGYYAGASNTTGFNNTFSGVDAGYSNTTGYENTFSGVEAGYYNTTGFENTFLGFKTGFSNTSGYGNTFSGFATGYYNTTGSENTFSGYYAGYSNTTGLYNTFSGANAGLFNTTGNSNTFSGFEAGASNTTGSNNTFSGYYAGFSNTSGYLNTFSGNDAGHSNTTGSSNVFSGDGSGYNNTTGSYNSFFGSGAGVSNGAGIDNTYLGFQAGYYNTTGSGNVFIGFRGGYYETGSNKLYIDNDGNGALIYGDFSAKTLGIGTTTIQAGHAIDTWTGAYLSTGGTWTNNSSRDVKENFTPADTREVLEKLVKVPVSIWNYKVEDKSTHHMGPMAQDLYEAFELGDSDKSIATIDADGISLAAIQGLYQIVKEKDSDIATLKKENESMKKENEDIKARLAAMESIVSKLSQQEGGIK